MAESPKVEILFMAVIDGQPVEMFAYSERKQQEEIGRAVLYLHSKFGDRASVVVWFGEEAVRLSEGVTPKGGIS